MMLQSWVCLVLYNMHSQNDSRVLPADMSPSVSTWVFDVVSLSPRLSHLTVSDWRKGICEKCAQHAAPSTGQGSLILMWSDVVSISSSSSSGGQIHLVAPHSPVYLSDLHFGLKSTHHICWKNPIYRQNVQKLRHTTRSNLMSIIKNVWLYICLRCTILCFTSIIYLNCAFETNVLVCSFFVLVFFCFSKGARAVDTFGTVWSCRLSEIKCLYIFVLSFA